MFRKITTSDIPYEEELKRLKKTLTSCDAVLIGAGAGLSAAAGYAYSGARFQKYFYDFAAAYGITDMYSGGFFPFPDKETLWAWWSRQIWLNRYAPMPSGLYEELHRLVKDKDYFVLTTNVDHCFQKSGFDKRRLFYTQGDYGLFQSSHPDSLTRRKTYDNEQDIRKMVISQGFEIDAAGDLIILSGASLQMKIPTELIPYCPDDGQPMTTNLRVDDDFVEDEGWHRANLAYNEFLNKHLESKLLYLELGVGMNTPGIIKIPFWQQTAENPNAVYACINSGDTSVPERIKARSICITESIDKVIKDIQG